MKVFNLNYSDALKAMSDGKVCELNLELGNVKFSKKGDKLFICRAEREDKSIWVSSDFKQKILEGNWRLVSE